MTGIELVAAGGLAYLLKQGLEYPSAKVTQQVLYLERLQGIHPSLLAFVGSWQQTGKFPILAAFDGGLRTDSAKQLQYYNLGNSNAKTLDQTPHGRGAAMDLYPVGFDTRIGITRDSPFELNFKWAFYEMGEAAERAGLVWGGRWTKPYDLPHIEVPNWRSLPYPARY